MKLKEAEQQVQRAHKENDALTQKTQKLQQDLEEQISTNTQLLAENAQRQVWSSCTVATVCVHRGHCLRAPWPLFVCTVATVCVRRGHCLCAPWPLFACTVATVCVRRGHCLCAPWPLFVCTVATVCVHRGHCLCAPWPLFVCTGVVPVLASLCVFVCVCVCVPLLMEQPARVRHS
jgi:hypothetical protein